MGDAGPTSSGTVQAFQPRTVWIALAMLLVTIVALRLLGQPFWCECGSLVPWSWDIDSQHCSQHLIDAYFFTHVLHGLVFYVLLVVVVRWPRTVSSRFLAVLFLECFWEVLENSPPIIERYRTVTLSLGYFGDSIANSIVDILACCFGAWIACRAKVWQSVTVFVATELLLLATIRDCLTLNVVMLPFPIDAILEWQKGG